MNEKARHIVGYVLVGLIILAILGGTWIMSRLLPEPEGYAEPNFLSKHLVMGKVALPEGFSSWRELSPAVQKSLEYVRAKPQQEMALETEDLELTWGDLAGTLMELQILLPRLDSKPGLFADRFAWYELAPEPLMTGYYVPVLEAAPERSEKYKYPVYGVPEDLKSMDLGRFHHRWKGQWLTYRMEDGEPVPYFDRSRIDFGGALEGRAPVLAWAANLVDVFFLQIQGSGILKYPDGSTRFALYAGKNGLAYVSLGRELVRRGLMEKHEVSMAAIRDFIKQNPEMREELLSTNPSYVFFKLGEEGPYGAMGRLLTPRVSIATDPRLIPLGSLLLLDARLPTGEGEARIATPVLAQDTGGAIIGRHIDYYCGIGLEAGDLAGGMNQRPRLFLLVSKGVLER